MALRKSSGKSKAKGSNVKASNGKPEVSFADAIKGKGKTWKKARANEDVGGGDFTPPDVPNGTYAATVESSRAGAFEKDGEKVPYLSTTFVINEGNYQGEKPSAFVTFGNEKGEASLNRFIRGCGYEPPEDLADIPEFAALLTKEQPEVRIAVRNNVNVKDGKRYQNVFANGPVEE